MTLIFTSDESEPSWSIFSLAQLVTFSLQLEFFFQLENQKIGIFCHPDFFFLISHAFSLYFRFSLLQIILFLLKMTNFWVEDKLLELKKLYIKKKSSLVSARKIKYPARLDSARYLFSSARLSSGNFSSNSSLIFTQFFPLFLSS